MTEILKKTLRDSKAARWTALIIVSFTMLCGYFLADVMSPLMDMLGAEPTHWSSSEFGLFNSAYGWFNVFLLMLIFGGIILDKMGVRFTGTMACSFMLIGCAIKYYAIGFISPEAGEIMGIRTQVFTAAIGYAIFAMGTEIAGITVSKVIVKWFKGKEMALAMGIQVATARIGTMLALWITPFIAKQFSISTPLLVALIMLCIGTIAYIVYCLMDVTLDKQDAAQTDNDEEKFQVKDIWYIISNKGFWLIALLCVLFYSAVFPFLKYATSLMVNKYGLDPEWAGIIPGLLPFGNLLMTPFFGGIYDKKGHGATLMIIGSVLLVLVHILFALPILNTWWFAAFVMVLLGIAFSLVPSAMWPSVPKIIPERQFGTAMALIFWVQNWGLMGVPALIGWVLNKYCITGHSATGAATYDYTLPMCIFAAFGVLALIISLWLKALDKKKGYGLELPNTK